MSWEDSVVVLQVGKGPAMSMAQKPSYGALTLGFSCS
jgi:hypothetical protein